MWESHFEQGHWKQTMHAFKGKVKSYTFLGFTLRKLITTKVLEEWDYLLFFACELSTNNMS